MGWQEFLWPRYLDLTVLTIPTGVICHSGPLPLSLGQGHLDGAGAQGHIVLGAGDQRPLSSNHLLCAVLAPGRR